MRSHKIGHRAYCSSLKTVDSLQGVSSSGKGVQKTMKKNAAEDQGREPGEALLTPLDTEATGESAKSAPRRLLPAWLCLISCSHADEKQRLRKFFVCGGPREGKTATHTAVRPSLFLYDEMTVIIPQISAEHLYS